LGRQHARVDSVTPRRITDPLGSRDHRARDRACRKRHGL